MAKIKAVLSGNNVFSNSSSAFSLYNDSHFGEVVSGKVRYSLVEALYLLHNGKMELVFGKKKLSADAFMKEAIGLEPNFMIRSAVFYDLRSKGYLVKTALKFGADFRVYEKGKKMGEDHAKWIVFPVHESAGLTWHEFAAKNRVAHSAKKNLLIAIVDDEGEVTYYEASWIKP
jgi:tRNA-intron endonuclease